MNVLNLNAGFIPNTTSIINTTSITNAMPSQFISAISFEEKFKTRVKLPNGFSCVSSPYMDKKAFSEISLFIIATYKASYMLSEKTIHMDDTELDINNIMNSLRIENINMKNQICKVLRKYNTDHISFRITTSNMLYLISIKSYNDNYTINITQSAIKYKYLRCNMFRLIGDQNIDMYPLIPGDVILDLNSNMSVKELKYFAKGAVENVNLILYLCNLIMDTDEISEEYYDYSQPQLDVMHKLFLQGITIGKKSEHTIAYQVHSWENPNSEEAEINYDMIQNIADDIYSDCSHFDSMPLLDFSPRDFNWIYKYCENHGYHMKNDDETYDFSNILNDQRYGLNFRVMCDHDNKEFFEVGIYINYDEVSDNLQFFIVNENRDNHFSTIIIVNYPSAHTFSIGNFNKILELHSCSSIKGVQLPKNNAEACNRTPLAYIDLEGIIKIIINIVDVLIVIHDRPDRNRMIKEEHLKEESTTHKTTGKKSDLNKSNGYVIRRIIKTASAAKKYIAEKSINGERNVRYTLEEWGRVGHYRTYKNGKTVWIDETTCHRHKELSTDEIHIRL